MTSIFIKPGSALYQCKHCQFYQWYASVYFITTWCQHYFSLWLWTMALWLRRELLCNMQPYHKFYYLRGYCKIDVKFAYICNCNQWMTLVRSLLKKCSREVGRLLRKKQTQIWIHHSDKWRFLRSIPGIPYSCKRDKILYSNGLISSHILVILPMMFSWVLKHGKSR